MKNEITNKAKAAAVSEILEYSMGELSIHAKGAAVQQLLDTETAALTAENADLAAKLEAVKKERDLVKKQTQHVHFALGEGDSAFIGERVSEVVERRNALIKENRKLNADLAEARERLAELKESRDYWRSKFGTTNERAEKAEAERDALRARVEVLERALKDVEWSRPTQDHLRECPSCGVCLYFRDEPRHRAGCTLAAALSPTSGTALLDELARKTAALKRADDRLHLICGSYMAIAHGDPVSNLYQAIHEMGDDMHSVSEALAPTNPTKGEPK